MTITRKRNGWNEISLANLIEVKHGYAFPGENIREEPTTDVLLTPGNFAIGGGFKGDKFKYFDGEVPLDYVLKEGDLLVTMTDLSKQADTLGYPALVPKMSRMRFLHNQRLGKVVIKPGVKLDMKFLFYLLRTDEYRHEVLASATGTTVKHTSPSRILSYKAALPPIPEQKAIAHILGTLDDKIELNRRMNATLDAMARALFQSWFVDFDPVRAKLDDRKSADMDVATAALFPDCFQDSSLGPMPKGWEVKPMSEIIEVNPLRSLKPGVVASYLDMKNMPTQGHAADEVIQRTFKSGTKFKNGDTLLARITPCLENGKTAFVDFLKDGEVGWGSTEYIIFSPRHPLIPEFGYYLARSENLRAHAIRSMTGTSGRQRVPSNCFQQFMLVVPPANIAQKFGELARPWMTKIHANIEESRTLASLRDRLLPKLLSGNLQIGHK